MDKSILRKWLKAGYIERRVLKATEEGTPQGGICSPVIAHRERNQTTGGTVYEGERSATVFRKDPHHSY